nr:autotransporter domain-containing protein [Rhodopseudomonas palustris]
MRAAYCGRFKSRLFHTTALVAVAWASSAQAQTANVTIQNVNAYNLLAPFLALNSTAIGQATLQANLQQSILINNTATAAQQALAISDKALPGSGSFATNITLSDGSVVRLGLGDNLAGGLPLQAIQSSGSGTGTINPIQPVGGYGQVLGSIYQTGIRASNASSGPLTATYNLLNSGYNFTSSDVSAKNYFANGTTNGTVKAVAPAGTTLPTFNGLPNTTDSVYDLAYGVTNKQAGQGIYGDSRPVQVARSSFNAFDPTALDGLTTNPAFPSGHTNYAYTDSILLGMLVPQLYQSMLVRASEYANSRIALGVHYPLDIIASRAMASYDLGQAFSNPAYINNAAVTGTAVNLPALFTAAQSELTGYLSTGAASQSCGTITVCATTNNPYAASSNQAVYQQRLTYGLPTLSYAQAPREAAPSGGPDASILLAPIFGGSTSAAKTLAPSGGLYGNLQTDTINQIIVNTEGVALAAFYGTPLSYWTRLDLYSAIGYFQNVTGTISLASSDVVTTNVIVANTGVLAGTGTVGATTVLAGGALQPGNGAAGSSLKISGNLAMQAGALYLVQASPAGTPFTSVSGSASLAGTVQVSSATGTYRFNTPTTILTAASLGGTTFGAVTAPAGVTGVLSYSGTTVSLSLQSGLGQIAGLNDNQRAVGAGLDAAFNANGGPGPLGAIFTGNVGQNLAQAGGQGASGVQQTSFNMMNQFVGVLLDPSIGGRGPMGPGTGPASAFAEEGDALSYAANERKRSGAERDAYAMATKAAPLAVYQPRWGVWAAGFGGSQTTNGDAGAGTADTTSRIYGVAVGADYYFSPDTVAGFALAGGATKYDLGNGLGSGKSDVFQAGAFVRHNIGPSYLSAALAYGWQDVTTNRTLTIAGIDQLQGRFNANALTGRVESGYRFVAPEAIGLTPYAAAQVTTFMLPSYAETGTGAFGLAYASKDVTAARTELGLRSDKSFIVEDALLTLRGRAAWAHDFNADRTVTATFQALPAASFTVAGAAQPHDLALTSASAELKWRNGISVAATFEGEFSNVSQSYTGKGTLRYNW